MGELKFMHRISKGTRFNQIYIPKYKEKEFEPGDLVEVKLLEKESQLFAYNASLTKFKKKLIEDIFNFFRGYNCINQVFVFGSFFFDKVDYNDIDILILSKDESNKFLDKLYSDLKNEFNLRFHVILANEEKLNEELKFSPMVRSMFSHFVSNKKFKVSDKREVDKNNILFLIMGAEDILKFDFDNGRIYYDSLRKVKIIERFLKDKEEDVLEVNEELCKELGAKLFDELRRNEIIGNKERALVRGILKREITFIKERINNGEEKRNR